MAFASLIIPSHAGRQRLPRLLDALAAQSYSDWEAIVVIDGVVDDSPDIVTDFSRRIPVRAITLPTNRGRVSALNTGFEAAEGDVLVRCDDDFEPGPHHIAAHVAAHRDQLCGAIGLPQNIAPDNAYMRAYGEDADRRSRDAAYAAEPQERWRYWGGNTSVSRDVWEQIGLFDTSYQGYGWEDVDYGYRIHQAGLPIVLVPDAQVRHHMASVTTTLRAQRALWSGQARWHFEQLHGYGSARGHAAPSGAWSRLTAAAAKRLDEQRVGRTGRLIDTALPFLPKPLGRKAVALLVEAAADAGFRSGGR